MFAPAGFVKQGNGFFKADFTEPLFASTRLRILLAVAALSSPFCPLLLHTTFSADCPERL